MGEFGIGPVPIGAPQKKAAMQGAGNTGVAGGKGGDGRMAFRGGGQGVEEPQFAWPEASKSAKLGKMSREGVNPGQITKFRM